MSIASHPKILGGKWNRDLSRERSKGDLTTKDCGRHAIDKITSCQHNITPIGFRNSYMK